ncbi:SymE family type I addiction module toxin [Bacteroides sp.]|uniref:SymE family type I addiction module toxin n=1 Tax=Bacteroides sp. TaxID=29523 RepID=UPI002584CD51|nr:SymE family type I addiction module toxin [Bacteroides sp.]
MAKLVSKKTTTTVTEEVEIVPATPGAEKGHHYLKVCGYGTYLDAEGEKAEKPQINMNAKWLEEAGFNVGDQIDVIAKENELVIRKLVLKA